MYKMSLIRRYFIQTISKYLEHAFVFISFGYFCNILYAANNKSVCIFHLNSVNLYLINHLCFSAMFKMLPFFVLSGKSMYMHILFIKMYTLEHCHRNGVQYQNSLFAIQYFVLDVCKP